MQPQPTYKLIVDVEGERVYFTEAYSADNLIAHLRHAEKAVADKQAEMIAEAYEIDSNAFLEVAK